MPSAVKIPTIEALKQESFSELTEGDLGTIRDKLTNQKTYLLIRRFLDIILALTALVLFSPVWLLLIILIRLDSRGRAIFIHKRIGKDGKLFTLYKFRTMHQGVKKEEYAPISLKDPRITRIGKVLRRTSLDEIPQLLNVLKGEMSLVGPRPEMKFIVDTYTPLQRKRLLVKPGITGLWQIMGRKDLPLHENVEFDLYYIMNRSLLLDLKIMLKTIIVVMIGKGAY